jgi:hypothetical protein
MINMLKSYFKKTYKVTVYYKSGHKATFRAGKFEINNGTYSWTATNGKFRPFQLGPDNIESVWVK